VSEDYLKLKKGPFLIKILAEFNELMRDHLIGGLLIPHVAYLWKRSFKQHKNGMNNNGTISDLGS
jgi:hypothetical protein